MKEDNMSDSQTILIPADPSYVPNNCIIKKIQELYSANLEIHDQVQFIDCGENLEQIYVLIVRKIWRNGGAMR